MRATGGFRRYYTLITTGGKDATDQRSIQLEEVLERIRFKHDSVRATAGTPANAPGSDLAWLTGCSCADRLR